MKFHIITIFPEAFTSFLETSIIGKGIDNNLFEVKLYKLNDFSDKNFGHVDNNAYGMHGQVISPEPLTKAIQCVKEKIDSRQTHRSAPTKNICRGEPMCSPSIIYMSPSGNLLNQQKVENYYHTFQEKDIIIICGHYEGIDQRIIDKYVDYEISIGEYVLTSGELASQIFIDSLVRHVPKVLGNKQSLEEESFSKFFDRQKEHPVYTRPRIFEGMEVPEVLTSGNHKLIEQWKQKNTK